MKILARFTVITLLILIASCSDSHQERQKAFTKWSEDNGKLKVLSTTQMIGDLVSAIGGEHVDTLTLIQGGLDPHSYQLVKGDDERLSAAQVIFYNGLDLEHGPSLANYLSKNPVAVGLGDFLYQFSPQNILFVGTQKDPHIWLDVSIWKKTIPFIVQGLSFRDPDHATSFLENGLKLDLELDKLNREITKILQEIPEQNRYLVTSHDAFRYFTYAYLATPEEQKNGQWTTRFQAPEGLAPDSQLSPKEIKEVIDHLKKYHIKKIFPESNVSRQSISKIARAIKEEGIDVEIVSCCPLYGDSMGAPGSEADTYMKMMLSNAKILSKELSSLNKEK